MNAILGMIDLALRKELDPTTRDYLNTARESADVLLTLLNDLLDSAKIESGNLELEAAPLRLRRILDQVTRALSVRASEKGLAFDCRVPEDVPDGCDWRRGAAAASALEPCRQRHQVHRARRSSGAGSGRGPRRRGIGK